MAAITGLTDFLGDRRIRALRDAWQHAIGNVILVLVQLFSFYQRCRYGTSAVVPLGLSLSLVAVLIMSFTGWKGGETVFRHREAGGRESTMKEVSIINGNKRGENACVNLRSILAR